jgi:hypothetical protein
MKAEPPDKVNRRGPMVGPKYFQRAQAKRLGTVTFIKEALWISISDLTSAART